CIGRADSRVTRAARRVKVATMRALLEAIIGAVVAALRARANLVAETLALRQQLAVLRRQTSRPQLRPVDRAFWVVLSRAWSRWADALAIVKPATVIAWHRRGFARFWAYKSRRSGRPPVGRDVVDLIERMATENPMWSRRRIAAELAKLGHDVSKDTRAGYFMDPRELAGSGHVSCGPSILVMEARTGSHGRPSRFTRPNGSRDEGHRARGTRSPSRRMSGPLSHRERAARAPVLSVRSPERSGLDAMLPGMRRSHVARRRRRSSWPGTNTDSMFSP